MKESSSNNLKLDTITPGITNQINCLNRQTADFIAPTTPTDVAPVDLSFPQPKELKGVDQSKSLKKTDTKLEDKWISGSSESEEASVGRRRSRSTSAQDSKRQVRFAQSPILSESKSEPNTPTANKSTTLPSNQKIWNSTELHKGQSASIFSASSNKSNLTISDTNSNQDFWFQKSYSDTCVANSGSKHLLHRTERDNYSLFPGRKSHSWHMENVLRAKLTTTIGAEVPLAPSLKTRSSEKFKTGRNRELFQEVGEKRDPLNESSNILMDPAKIAADILWNKSKKILGIDLSEIMEKGWRKSLFQSKVSQRSSKELESIFTQLFSVVEQSSELMRVACSVNRTNNDKQLTMWTLINKIHETVDCSGVCLYLLDNQQRLIIALTDEQSINIDVTIGLGKGMAGECVLFDKSIKSGAKITEYHLPEFSSTGKLPKSALFVPIRGADVKVMGVLGVFNSPKQHGFDEEDECLVSFISALAGYTLVNMLLFENETQKNIQVEYLMQSISRLEAQMWQGPARTIAELVELSYKLFNCERIAFFEIDRDELICTVSKDFAQGRVPKDKGLIGYVVESGETVNIPDAYNDPRFNSEVDVRTNFQTKSLLATPVFDEYGNVIGVIQCINKRRPQEKFSEPVGVANTYSVIHRQPQPKEQRSTDCAPWTDEIDVHKTGTEPIYNSSRKASSDKVSDESSPSMPRWGTQRLSSCFSKEETVPFPDADRGLIETLAKSSGVVIAKARVLRKLVMAQRKNRALIHILKVTSSDLELPERLEQIANQTCEIIGSDRTSIFLVDNDEKRLCSIVSKDAEMVNLCVPLGQGIVGSCFESRKPIRVDNVYSDSRFLRQIDDVTGYVTISLLAVPIADARGNYIGVLEALNKKEDDVFSKEDEELLTAISMEVGECIRRGLLLPGDATRQLLHAQNLEFPWQSAIMEIYSRNYSFGITQASTTLHLSDEFSTSEQTAEMDFIRRRSNWNPLFVATDITEALQTTRFDVLNYKEEALDEIVYLIFSQTKIIEEFSVNKKILRNFIAAVGKSYYRNPFHNYHHGVHVLQYSFYFLRSTIALKFLRPMDILGILVAALCHDLRHPGHSSDFEIKTGSELAERYNDLSVLENMHAYETFQLLKQAELNIFSNLDTPNRRELRKIIINAILATDMTNHKNFVMELAKADTPEDVFDAQNNSSRQFLINTIVHGADLSAQVYVWNIAQKWEERITQEFLKQVDQERQLKIAPSSFMAELNQPAKRYNSQIFFCDKVLKPFWSSMGRIFPPIGSSVENLRTNRLNYQELVDQHTPVEEKKEEKEEITVIISQNPKKKKIAKPILLRQSTFDKLWDRTKNIFSNTGDQSARWSSSRITNRETRGSWASKGSNKTRGSVSNKRSSKKRRRRSRRAKADFGTLYDR